MHDFDALVARAQAAYQARQYVAAAEMLRQIIALRPEIAEPHCSLGNVLSAQGQLAEAAAEYERAIALKPELFAAQNNLGSVLRLQGRYDEALARYRSAVALRPDLAGPHNNLGNLLFKQGRLDEAVAEFEQALSLAPNSADAHNNLGAVLRAQGKLEQSAARFERSLALRDDYPEAHNNLGNVLWELGRFDEAAARYDRALALKPDYAEAHHDRCDVKTFRRGDADLAALEALAAEPAPLPPDKMVYIHFALGKALTDVGEHARAFAEWQKGNALKRREISYDEAGHLENFRRVARTFTPALISRLSGAGDPSPRPIFVLGMPRSGSTLIEQILASHPQVYGAGELWNLDRVVRSLVDPAGQPAVYPEAIARINKPAIARMGQAYMASLPAKAAGYARVVDKAPSNFTYLGLIHLILPHAQIIHSVRDPIDTCVSCYSLLFNQGQLFSYDLAELGRYYRGYQELMQHWHDVLPAGSILDVAYEEVVADLEGQARRLIEFCGLEWDDRCLSFHETERSIGTASNQQVRQPLYRGSVERWRRYEPFLGPLLEALGSRR